MSENSISRSDLIAAKRAKIAEMKRARAEKAQPSSVSSVEPDNIPKVRSLRSDKDREIDELLNSISGPRSSSTIDSDIKSPSRGLSRPEASRSDTLLNESRGITVNDHGNETSHSLYDTITTTQPSGLDADIPVQHESYTSPELKIPVKEIITYSKEVQTTQSWFQNDDDNGYESETKKINEAKLREKIRLEVTKELEEKYEVMRAKSVVEKKVTANENLPLDLRALEKLSLNPSLEQFLTKSLTVVERALAEDYDILVDYGSTSSVSGLEASDTGVNQSQTFYSSEFSKGRAITSLNWSTKFPELLAVSYTSPSSTPASLTPASNRQSSSLKGLVIVWNTHLPSRPEYVFQSQSSVLCASFSSFHPHLVFGSCYNGQIVTWDMRDKTPMAHPVLKSLLTGISHTYPIYALEMQGTQHAPSIVSASTDGTACIWAADILAKPQERLSLSVPPSLSKFRNDDVAPTSLILPHMDTSYFLIGTEEGTIYHCNRYDRANTRSGIDPKICYQGHDAPVTSMDLHSNKGPIDFGNLFLSTSLDWTIKLWKLSGTTTHALNIDGQPSILPRTSLTHLDESKITPILDISHENIVYEAKWHPTNPAIFGCVDESGHLEIWDLNKDIEAPIIRVKPFNDNKKKKSTSFEGEVLQRPLNRLDWSHSDGKKIAVGGIDGVVTVFDIKESIIETSGNEWISLSNQLASI
ncbi:WD40 repeat-like protein [Nadsonia fulvescens var. elongata DSM 6958]|uniref:WD40 repeat-like protein n=1 Tax=Nadsonia fulvescens var. elongata DSM 6958 TaxID=857566 RepID=A0A1E3PF54_9ASCO|nr:WD40 repeat-like protein [Nadsonia fulvescens var. elongata DSM 6958]